MSEVYRFVLKIPEIKAAMLKTAYLELSGAFISIFLGSYISLLVIQKFYLKEDAKMDLFGFIFGLFSLPALYIGYRLSKPLNAVLVKRERLDELKEKEKSYNEYFEVEEKDES